MKDATPYILCVIYDTELYGSERGTLQAARSLQQSGYKVTIVGSKREPNGGAVGNAARAQGHDVRLLQFGSHLKKSWILRNKNYRKGAWNAIKLCHQQLRNILRETKPTHIMIGSTSVLPYIMGNLLFGKVKIIYRMGDAPVMDSVLHRPLWKWLIRKSHTIVTISNYMRQCLHENAGTVKILKKVETIRNIAPTRTNHVIRDTSEQEELSKKPFQLVYVGQFTEKKGIEILLDALIELDSQDVGCWFIGEFHPNNGSFNRRVKTKALQTCKTNIQWLGYLDDPYPYLKSADWHIAPSNYEEPLGNVVQEAQQVGTPSIVSNKGGLPELIEHEKSGWILAETTAREITRTILHLTSWPDWSKRAGLESLNHFRAYGEPEFSSLWTQVISKK